jgi:hypothetical protein
MALRLSTLRTGSALLPGNNIFLLLILISVRSWVNPKAYFVDFQIISGVTLLKQYVRTKENLSICIRYKLHQSSVQFKHHFSENWSCEYIYICTLSVYGRDFNFSSYLFHITIIQTKLTSNITHFHEKKTPSQRKVQDTKWWSNTCYKFCRYSSFCEIEIK